MNRMIFFFFLTLLAGGGSNAQGKGEYTIQGDLSPVVAPWGIDPDSLTLTFTKSNGQTDTLALENGKFTFSGHVDTKYVAYAYLRISAPQEDEPTSMTIPVFLEPGSIVIHCRELPDEEMFDITVKGTPSNDLISDRMSRYYDLNYEMLALALDTTVNDNQKSLRIGELYEQQDSLIRYLYRDNRDSPIAPMLAIQEFYGTNEFRELGETLQYLNEKFPGHPDLHDLESVWMSMEGIGVGDRIPELTLPDVHGNPIALYELLNGGYLLLDFWGTVVGPSLDDFAALKKIPDTYEGKRLVLAGISTDNSREVWLKTLKKHKPAGIQLWDREHRLSKAFHITSYPVRFLIAPDGTVVAKGNFTALSGIVFDREEE